MTCLFKLQLPKIQSFKLKQSLLILSLAAAYPLQANAAAAGVAQFTAGDVNLRSAGGQTSPLAKGADIESGQAILTGATGRAQVKFTDGGVISLQPNTEFKIANYVDKLDGKEDRFLVDLLRGSMRAITGLIGKRNRDNYRVTTTTATIGIRGSGFTAGYNPDGSLGVTAEKDAIEVCNAGVCVGLVAGESVTVIDKLTPPIRTVNKAAVPTPGPAQEAQVATQQPGLLARIRVPVPVAIDPLPTTPPVALPPTAALPDVSINSAAAFADSVISGQLMPSNLISSVSGGIDAIFNAAGRLVQIGIGGSTPNLTDVKYTSADPASPFDRYQSSGSPTDANFVGWGFWGTAVQVSAFSGTSSNNTNFSYVVGRPTPAGAILPTGVATYSAAGPGYATFRGATTGNIGYGSLLSANVSINFANNLVGASVVTTLGSFTNVGGNFSPTIRTFESTGGGGLIDPYYRGFLIGPTGDRAGMRFSIPHTFAGEAGITSGTIGLSKN